VREANEDFQRGSNLRNEKSPGKLRAALGNQLVVGLGFQPKLGNPVLFFSQQMKMPAQLIAEVREAQIDGGLKHTTMSFPQRVVHQLVRENSRPSLVEIPSRVRVAQRG
jgi:hypothetical protein